MRRALVYVALWVLALPVSWMVARSAISSAMVARAEESSNAEGVFVTKALPHEQDPLRVIRQSAPVVAGNYAAVNEALSSGTVRAVLVTHASEPMDTGVVDEVVRLCQEQFISCVRLELMEKRANTLSDLIPYIVIEADPKSSATRRLPGLYVYNDASRLIWYAPAAFVGRLTDHFTIVSQTVATLAKWAQASKSHSKDSSDRSYPSRTLEYGYFTEPPLGKTDDPLGILNKATDGPSDSLAKVRKTLAVSEPRMILVSYAEEPQDDATLGYIEQTCTAGNIPCVHLSLVAHLHQARPSPVPQAEIVIDTDTASPKKHDGLYVYTASGQLLWYCRGSEVRSLARVYPVIIETMNAVLSRTGKADKRTGRPPISPSNPSSRSIRAEADDTLRLASISGRVTDATKPSMPWLSLSRSRSAADAKNKSLPTLLVFWATWCVPCIEEFPEVEALRKKYDRKVLFIGLLDEPDTTVARARVAKAIKPYGFSLHYLMQDSSIGRQIFGKETLPLPSFAVFDQEGRLVSTVTGTIEEKRTAELLVASLERVTRREKKAGEN
jgi:thiol-disulfide isomerase/thioredoxin